MESLVEATWKAWDDFAIARKLAYKEEHGAIVGTDKLYDLVRGVIQEKELTWHDLVVGITHDDEKGKPLLLQAKGVTQKDVDALRKYWETPPALVELGKREAARIRAQKEKELAKMKAELEPEAA